MKQVFVTMAALTLSGAVMADSPASIVSNANQQWNQALNQGKLNELVALYETDATVSPGNGSLLEGHEAIRNLFSGFIDNGVHNHQIETVDIIAADKQITQIGYWQAEGVDAEQQPVSFGGVLVTVLEQNEAGEWQLQSHVWNAAP
ncbi:DUF4440 domain-containing protein [Methylophaga sp.]|jgi:ketosteroid isomerase-like protein|uniref:YybH family protein n=1 Tax=Methylophaga sp. TaxID=2024840 RepID=UPI0013FE90B5|nr:DUF4440 domain-containing protein [Methylophaga sp.]MTI64434.1 DUF4440 domain-containing protein [Methylophaga sp.]